MSGNTEYLIYYVYYDSLGQLIREDNRAKNYSYTYTYVKVINDQIYILCEVMNWNGEAFAVVFKYDFNIEQIFYVMSEKISDRVSTNYAFTISEE